MRQEPKRQWNQGCAAGTRRYVERMSSILELPAVRRRVAPISVEAYHVFLELGATDRRTELLRNVIVEKMTKSPFHEYLVSELFA